MLRFLGVGDTEKPGAADLIELLRQLDAAEALTETSETIARWAMRKLDEVADEIDAEHSDPNPALGNLGRACDIPPKSIRHERSPRCFDLAGQGPDLRWRPSTEEPHQSARAAKP